MNKTRKGDKSAKIPKFWTGFLGSGCRSRWELTCRRVCRARQQRREKRREKKINKYI